MGQKKIQDSQFTQRLE